MKEIKFIVTKQEDGWYLALPIHNRIGGATEAPDIKTLKNKIREFTSLSLSQGFYKEIGLSRNTKIKLIYSELLFENPEAEKILVIGSPIAEGYQAKCNSYVNLDLQHSSLEELQRMIADAVKAQGHQDKHVEFRLEEVLE